jgi:hypothetical protein
MKNVFQSFIVLTFSIFLFSCSKEVAKTPEPEMAVKTKEWLLNFKADAPQKERKDKIDEILAGLQTEKFAEERVNDQEYLTVFPLGATFRSTVALNNQHQDYLLVVSNNNRKILSAKVGRFFSGETDKHITPQAFLDFYNKQNPGTDGKYYFLSLAGNHLYDFTFKGGNRTSFGLVTNKKPELTGAARIAARCYQRYLVTTYYLQNGMSYDTWEYLGTFCDPIDPQLPQDDEGQGGSGGELILVKKPLEFYVEIGANFGWFVKSYEEVEAILDPAETFGGHFITITHKTSNYYGVTLYSYREVTNTATKANNWIVTSQTTGELKDNDGVLIPVSKGTTWSFQAVFP